MSHLAPWADGPFELLVHAEGHFRSGEDFDRRMALISFDNTIEVSITTYLALHPIQRGNRTYKNEEIEKWIRNYHSKLDFLDAELISRKLTWRIPKSHIIWAHEHRNEQYHGGSKGTPEKKTLQVVRGAALWIFGVLYDVENPEQILNDAIVASIPSVPIRTREYDCALDEEFGITIIAGRKYYTSELLFGVDPIIYQSIAQDLLASADNEGAE